MSVAMPAVIPNLYSFYNDLGERGSRLEQQEFPQHEPPFVTPSLRKKKPRAQALSETRPESNSAEGGDLTILEFARSNSTKNGSDHFDDASPINEKTVSEIHTGTFVKTTVQEWEALIIDISNGVITAYLTDITAGHTHETEEMEINISNLTEGDRKYASVGSRLRIVIGYRREKGKQEIRRYSQVLLRKIPAWRKFDLKIAEQRAERWINGFK